MWATCLHFIRVCFTNTHVIRASHVVGASELHPTHVCSVNSSIAADQPGAGAYVTVLLASAGDAREGTLLQEGQAEHNNGCRGSAESSKSVRHSHPGTDFKQEQTLRGNLQESRVH